MEPTIPRAAEVLVEFGAEGRPGDVVACLMGGRLVLHRLVMACPGLGLVVTRGDASVVPDPPIAAAQVVGRVVGVRQDGDVAPPGPAPASVLRGLVLSTTVRVLRRSPGAARRLIAALWLVRRCLVLLPRAARARLAGLPAGRSRRRRNP
jgi:hypothetical protein